MKILNLEGGGIKGIVTLAMLHQYELFTGVPIAKSFDLIIGTSTGGIIACGYGYGYTTQELVSLYIKNAQRIFYRNTWWKIKSGMGLLQAKYNNVGLYETLVDYFGHKPITSTKVRVITTSYNTITNDVVLFDSKDSTNYSIVDACMATSAAPTLFPSYFIDNERNFIDGGIFAGNTDIIALGEAIKAKENCEIVSFGTGIYPNKPYNTSDWGVKEWLIKDGEKPLIDMIFDSQRQVNQYVMAKACNEIESAFTYKHYNINLRTKIALDESDPKKLEELYNYCNSYTINF